MFYIKPTRSAVRPRAEFALPEFEMRAVILAGVAANLGVRAIPFLDLKAATDELRQPIADAVDRVANSGWYILGPEVQAFEEAFARCCGELASGCRASPPVEG